MRFKLATACTGSSHDSRNDPGRSGLARKGNYVLCGRTSHARARVASSGVWAAWNELPRSERCPRAGAARQRAVHYLDLHQHEPLLRRAPRR